MLFGLLIFFLIVLFILAAITIKIIRPYEEALVERLGSFNRKITSGMHFIFPFIENIQVVDLRERVADVPPQEVICKDNVVVVVDAVIYYQIIDPVKVVYNVNRFLVAIVKLAQTNLRSIIGEMELDETLSGRDVINSKLRDELDRITDKWGVKVTRVEIKRIDPPETIQEAMAKQMRAERERRSVILMAEGTKTSDILRAEGEKQAKITSAQGIAKAKVLDAEADANSRLLRAEAEAKAIEMILKSLKVADERYLSLKYIEQLPEMAKSSNTILLPFESSEFMSSIKAITEVVGSKKKKSE